MPVHDWTRVDAGIFHDFHNGWIVELRTKLNNGILPSGYYALSERVAGNVIPDILTLKQHSTDPISAAPPSPATAVVERPPQVQHSATLGQSNYLALQRAVVVRREADDSIVALIELVSSGNQDADKPFRNFIDKCAEAIASGYHLLIIDLYPPSSRDPQGIHGAIWERLEGEEYLRPKNKPMTLAAYDATDPTTAYVEPLAVGDKLATMPLFLTEGYYVDIPLEETYQVAMQGIPKHLQSMLATP